MWFSSYPGQTIQSSRSVQRISKSDSRFLTATILKLLGLWLWNFRTSKMSKLSTSLLLTSFAENIIIFMNFSTQQLLLMQSFSWIIRNNYLAAYHLLLLSTTTYLNKSYASQAPQKTSGLSPTILFIYIY